MNTKLQHSIIAGLLSSSLYVLSVSGVLVGMLVMLLPTLPLFWVTFRYGAQAITRSIGVACLSVALLTGMEGLVMFAAYIAAPCWVMSYHLLKVRVARSALLPKEEGETPQQEPPKKLIGLLQWQSAGNAIIALLLYVMISLMLATTLLHFNDTSLIQLVQKDMANVQKTMDAELAGTVRDIVEHYLFFMLGFMVWIWTSFTYGAAALANFACLTSKEATSLRPTLSLRGFLPPDWWFAALLVSGAGFWLPSPDAQLVSGVCFIIMLYPYFLAGIGILSTRSQRLENRGWWISGFFLLLALFLLPLMTLITFWGLTHHIRQLLATDSGN